MPPPPPTRGGDENGSNSWASADSSMPPPLSDTVRTIARPDDRSTAFGDSAGMLAVDSVGLSARGHGVAGMGGKVEQHLLDAVGVHPDRSQGRVEVQPQINGRAEQALEDLGAMEDDVVEVEKDGVQHLLAADGQQLTDQGRQPFAGLLDQRQRFVIGIVRPMGVEQEMGITRDDGEEVVKVVSHAAG